MQLSTSFTLKLEALDKTLGAWFDISSDTLNVFSNRCGNKELVMAMARDTAESYHDLEHRMMTKLHEADVWKRYGSPGMYEKHLQFQEDKYRAEKKKEYQEKRKQLFKDNRHLIADAVANAKRGIVNDEVNPNSVTKTKRFFKAQ